MRMQRNGNHTSQRRRRDPNWDEITDDELLDMRMCDLNIEIEGTSLEDRIDRLNNELEYREIRHRPHFWLSEEWFSPDGVPGVAIPFYLAHPRLMRLERKQMLEVEGGTQDWCMKILRHEAGHALDTAYRLHRRRLYRDTFGRSSAPYPEFYTPKPLSKQFVMNLDRWYAQSHPVEDFAETFAVWLKPRSRWRRQYQGWPALEKLEVVDELMGEIRHTPPQVRSTMHIDPLREIRTTLREHYDRKRERYGVDQPHFYDRDLERLFVHRARPSGDVPASMYLRRNRKPLRDVVARWTGGHPYTIDQVFDEMIARCRHLRLYLDRPEDKVGQELVVMLTVQTMNYLHGGCHKLAL